MAATERQQDQAFVERERAENLRRAGGLTFHGVPIVWNPAFEDSDEARMAWALLQNSLAWVAGQPLRVGDKVSHPEEGELRVTGFTTGREHG